MRSDKSTRSAHKGVTAAEALVVGGIVVVLIVGIVFLRMFLQSRSADLQTISDIARVQSALEFTYAVNTHFPIYADVVPLGSAEHKSQRLCLRGFTSSVESCERVVMHTIPNAGTGGYVYQTFDGGQSYGMTFTLARNHRSLGLMRGQICATPDGFSQGPCLTQ